MIINLKSLDFYLNRNRKTRLLVIDSIDFLYKKNYKKDENK